MGHVVTQEKNKTTLRKVLAKVVIALTADINDSAIRLSYMNDIYRQHQEGSILDTPNHR